MEQEQKLKVLSVKDVASIFGVTEEFVTQTLCKIKGFPFTRIKHRYFFEENMLLDWLRDNKGSIFR